MFVELDMINRMSDVQNLEADIAIQCCKETPADFIERRIGSIKFVACAARNYCREKRIDGFHADTDAHQFIVLADDYADTPFQQ